jgi:hypothetical protein
MSVIRSKTLTVEITHTSSDRKALRPSAAAIHDTPATPVYPLVMYSLMYIFFSPYLRAFAPVKKAAERRRRNFEASAMPQAVEKPAGVGGP